MEVISYIEHTLSKAIQKDWRYHVLHRIPLFHQLCRLHQGLDPSVNDPAHAFRVEHFQQLFSKIQE
jgi:hypothetical protein